MFFQSCLRACCGSVSRLPASLSGPQAPCDLAQCLGGWLWSQGGISLSPLPQSSESVTLDLLTYTDLESLRSRKLGGRPGALAPRSAQLNSKRYLILIYSVEFDRWARGLAQGPGWWQGWEEPQGQVPGMILLYLQSLDSVSLYCCDWLQVTEQSVPVSLLQQLTIPCTW